MAFNILSTQPRTERLPDMWIRHHNRHAAGRREARQTEDTPMTSTTAPRKTRNAKCSDRAFSITLTFKVSTLQQQLIQAVKPTDQSLCEWLRLAAVSAAYHERNRLALESAAGTSGAATVQDVEAAQRG